MAKQNLLLHIFNYLVKNRIRGWTVGKVQANGGRAVCSQGSEANGGESCVIPGERGQWWRELCVPWGVKGGTILGQIYTVHKVIYNRAQIMYAHEQYSVYFS